MTTASAHEFFSACASVGGTLIGLLFVAISVAPERIIGPDASDVYGVRAAATLTAFTNALTVVLFGLIPAFTGYPATVVAIISVLFVPAALLRVLPGWRAKEIRVPDVTFLVGLLIVFVIQLIAGIGLARHASDSGDLKTICVLVIVCFLIGIERAWQLVGGPQVRLSREVVGRVREGLESSKVDDAGDT